MLPLMSRRTIRPIEALFISVILLTSLVYLYSSLTISSKATGASGTAQSWTFNSTIHADNHALNHEQCSVAFPDLYHSLDQRIRNRQGKPITLADIEVSREHCMLRAMVYEHELYVIDLGVPQKCYVFNVRERIMAELSSLNQALSASPEAIPNIEFAITLDDLPRRSKPDGVLWALTRQNTEEYEDVWLMPDYGYWSWHMAKIPSYQRLRHDLRAIDDAASFADKFDKAVWRGKAQMNPVRGDLVDAVQGKPWSDVKDVDIWVTDQDVLSFEEMCRFKFVIQTEGTSYSGRLKYLQLCRSVIVSHVLQWEEFHTHLMIPAGADRNYVEVEDGWSTMDSEIRHLLAHPDEAEEIAQRSYDTFSARYLTPAAISCYWRRLFTTWAALQDFEPELYEMKDGRRTMRGTPFSVLVATWPEDPSQIP